MQGMGMGMGMGMGIDCCIISVLLLLLLYLDVVYKALSKYVSKKSGICSVHSVGDVFNGWTSAHQVSVTVCVI